MYAVGRLGSYISRGVYTVSGPFHPFGGAVDIIVVEQPDGSFRSSPWYVRFGKFQGVLKAKEKVVKINVNGVDAGFHMYLDHKGEAYFLKEIDEDEECIEPNLYPSSSSDDEASDAQSKSTVKSQRPMKSQSFNLDDTVSGQLDSVQGKIVAQTSSRRSRILGFVFGRRSMKEESFRAEEEVFYQGLGRTESLERAEVAADLLELKWSEGLTTKKYMKGSTSRFSTHDDSNTEFDADNRVYDESSSRDSRNVKENIEMVTFDDRRIDSAGEEVNKDIDNVVAEITAEVYEESCTERIQSSDHAELPESLHSGFNGLADEYRETLCLNADGEAGEACLETMLVEGEGVSKDPVVIDMKTTYEESQEVILLNSLEDEANESRDGLITGDGSRGQHHPDLESVGKLENSFINNKFSRPASSSSSESSEEVQFHFTDLDDLETSKQSHVHRFSPDLINDEEMSMGLEKLDHELSTDNFKADSDKVISTPINIIKLSHGVDDDVEVVQLVKSMPPMRSQIENIDPYLIQAPLSQSLDIDIKHLGLSTPPEEYESPLKSKEDLDQDRYHESRDEQTSEEVGNIPLSSEVELSLCRQMLYEGMGAEAASQAFESAKLDRDKFLSLCPVIMEDDRLVVRIRGRYFPWEAAAPLVLGIVSFGSELLTEPKGMINVEKKDKEMLDDDMSRVMSPSSGGWRLWPFSRRYRSGKVMQDTGMFSADEKDKEKSSDQFGSPNKSFIKPKSGKKLVRSIIPTSEQVASLNLKEGSNLLTFTFSTAMLGDQQVDARIYLWKWNTRIIISDVDGTITKSDVLGQFMPLVGMDWSQTGVAHLFTAIKENGYQLLFLSARAISQAYNTRRFLFSLKQDGKCLPDGPVVISPDGLFPSLFREVIRRAPHEFKIACLEDIKALFPPDSNPFYAGFGNRITDEISYLKVGIPKGKIFTINPKGEVVVNKHINTKSYTSLHELVHGMFPPTAKSEQEDFNSWNYWKLPPPDIDI